METLLIWLNRFIHVTSASIWVGGFGALALVIIPLLVRSSASSLLDAAVKLTRVLSFSALLTILSGLALVQHTRGFGALTRGEWGGIVIGAIILSVALGAIGDAGIRPSLRRSVDDPKLLQRAQRLAMFGFVLSILALALMTRAIYART